MEYLKMITFRDLPYTSNIDKLTNREIKIIELRQQDFSLLDIGRMFGVTRERIRQIEASAFNKLEYHCLYQPILHLDY